MSGDAFQGYHTLRYVSSAYTLLLVYGGEIGGNSLEILGQIRCKFEANFANGDLGQIGGNSCANKGGSGYESQASRGSLVLM